MCVQLLITYEIVIILLYHGCNFCCIINITDPFFPSTTAVSEDMEAHSVITL